MDPAIAVDGEGAINVVWEGFGGRLAFSRSTDGGATFSPSIRFGGHPVSLGADDPNILDMAVDDEGAINVVWMDNDILLGFSRSTDEGATFSPPIEVPNTFVLSGVRPRNPEIAVDGEGAVYVVFSDVRDDGYCCVIRFSRSL